MPVESLIIGVDLSPIKAIPRVITFQSDITTDKCRATIRGHLKTWKADTVLHDGAPNVGTAWVQDSFNQAELALQAMKLATDFLVEGGTFVTKVFRSKDYNSLLWVFNQLFEKVEATKPPSSRNVSAEIFVVCRGFKAPKRIDPKFLDPRSVFAELSDPTPNNEAKVFNPEIKKRKRDGYEEGNYTQYKEVTASEFINTVDPIAILGSINKLSFEQPPNGDVALAALDKLPETTKEIRDCCADLRVLGRKEFKNLLRWRLKVREKFGFPTKKSIKNAVDEEVAEVEPMDEELKIQEELQALSEKQSGRKKRERRRENEKKQKEIIRMQLHMTAPTEIGMEQAGPNGEGSMFGLKAIDKSGAANKIAKGKMAILTEADHRKDHDSGFGSEELDEDSDPEEDQLDREMDSLYEQYQERKSDSDAKFRAKKARKEHEDGDWEGFSADGHSSSDDDEKLDVDSSDESDDDEGTPKRPLLTDLEPEDKKAGGLSRRATQFFDQDIFKDIGGIPDEDSESDVEMDDDEEEISADLDKLDIIMQVPEAEEDSESNMPTAAEEVEESDSEEENGFEVVKKTAKETQWEEEAPMKDGKLGMLTAHFWILRHS
jgi:AdoMet-dependent rRNA methyltransferase SPB1